jgi:hypothetical protein
MREAMQAAGRRSADAAASRTAELISRRIEALEQQRTAQQGFGKPIISAEVAGGHRIVAVGNTVHFNRTWKTFPDFLNYVLSRFFGGQWGNAELKKDEGEMHPVALWYRRNALQQAKHAGKAGEVFSMPDTGASHAYLELGYNLYLLEHNAELQQRLINRLKQSDQFLGALSEVRIAGMLVRAGFSIKFHDEGDSSKTHCEYDVRRLKTGKSFSVEVKTKHWNEFPENRPEGQQEIRIHVARLLRRALMKEATEDRIVFIELAMPHEGSGVAKLWWMQSAEDAVRDTEQWFRNRGEEPPPAMVIVSNHPYQYHLESQRSVVGYAVDGIGATDFRSGLRGTIRQALRFRERHADFLAVWESIKSHRMIPGTFDGSSAHLSFGGQPPRMIVGERYEVPDADGATVAATLVDALAMPTERRLYGIYEKETGGQIICHSAMTEEEARAYAEHPDTFFGVVKKQGSATTPLELFDFFFESYGRVPKDKLLKLMASRPDIGKLQALTQRDLAEIYCEAMVSAVPGMTSQQAGGKPIA